MAPNDKERTPCDNCRDRHIKCSRGDPCESCTKHDLTCVRARAFRFKKAHRFKSNLSFSADQPWLESNTDRLSYVDMTKNITRKHGASGGGTAATPAQSTRSRTIQQPDENSTIDTDSEVSKTVIPPRRASSFPPADRVITFGTAYDTDPANEYRLEQSINSRSDVMSPSVPQWHPITTSDGISKRSEYDTARDQWVHTPQNLTSPVMVNPSTHTSPVAAATNRSNQSTALSGVPETTTDASYLGLQEACLLRHFSTAIAPWFDTCDRDQHYSIVVPQRAMFCPVLLYAVYTAAARHLTRLPARRNRQNVVECHSIPLPDLTEETAIHYHNICINHLIEISNDPTQSYNEDALTAATILRFYEQIDAPLTGCDSQTYLNVIRTVIDTQKDPSFYAIWKIQGPSRDLDLYASPACSLRHHACMLALQQEIWSILLSQRPCRLPLCPNNDYTIASLTPTDDFVWASRILVWTADVLKFCYGDENSNTINMSLKTRTEHWEALKQFEESWSSVQPPSYKPIYHAIPDPTKGRIFPEFWHTSDCQTVALQHIELSKLLLAVHSPKLPRLGLGAEAAQRAIKMQTREACLKICGLAASRRMCATAMATAAIGISICGECLTTPDERDAVVTFMEELEFEHAWPTKAVVEALKESWTSA